MKERLPAPKVVMRPPIDTQARGLRGGAYSGPSINKGRSDITQVVAWEPGHKGKQQKPRKRWPYQD